MKLPKTPSFSLKYKRALVSGASSGIGLACAAALAEHGASVTIAARRKDKLNKLSNLLFSLLAWYGKSELLFATAVILDEITSAISTVVFVAFVSILVDRTYTATHYALMASLATFGKNVFSAFSGFVVDKLQFLNTTENLHNDWAVFFVITTLMVIPSLIFLWVIKDKLNISEK